MCRMRSCDLRRSGEPPRPPRGPWPDTLSRQTKEHHRAREEMRATQPDTRSCSDGATEDDGGPHGLLSLTRELVSRLHTRAREDAGDFPCPRSDSESRPARWIGIATGGSWGRYRDPGRAVRQLCAAARPPRHRGVTLEHERAERPLQNAVSRCGEMPFPPARQRRHQHRDGHRARHSRPARRRAIARRADTRLGRA